MGEEQSAPDRARGQPLLLSDPRKGAILRNIACPATSASSVMQKNIKLFGPMNALDVENGSSSWNSEGNTVTETTLTLLFGRRVIPTTLKLQFQAGFSAGSCDVVVGDGATLVDGLEWEDVHEVQVCELSDKIESPTTSSVKIVLDNFSDFYGRVILYRLEVWGYEVIE